MPGNEDCESKTATPRNSCKAWHERDVKMGGAEYAASQCIGADDFQIPQTYSTTTTRASTKKCDYTTTTTTTTTITIPPFEPSCSSESLEFTPYERPTPITVDEANYVGYIPSPNPERDGVFTYDKNSGTVLMTQHPLIPNDCVNHPALPPLNESISVDEFYHTIGHMKLWCAGWTYDLHEEARANSWDTDCQSEANAIFTYDNLAIAVGYFPDFMGYNSKAQNQLDLAAFLAHSSRETGGGHDNTLIGWAWCFAFEREMPSTTYGNQDSMSKSCASWYNVGTPDTKEASNYGYYGRGSIQLSYCYNYGGFMKWCDAYLGYPHEEIDFITNPGLIATGPFGFAAGLWFYMSPERSGSKPSMHSVVNYWAVHDHVVDRNSLQLLPYDSGLRLSDFGYQINVLNGGMECKGTSHPGPAQRASYLNLYLNWLGFDAEGAEAIVGICGGCTGKPDMAQKPFKGFYDPITGSVSDSGTILDCSTLSPDY